VKPYYERDGIVILPYPAVCGRLSVWMQNDHGSNVTRRSAEYQHASAVRTCRFAPLGRRRATSNPLSMSLSAPAGVSRTMPGRELR